MKVTVIVPVFNQWHLLTGLIDSFSRQSGGGTRELVIVDNGSHEIPVLSESTNIIVTECKQPGSYAARNAGLALVTRELILFTDADCMPENDWIENMLEAYERSDKKTLLAGNVIIKSNSAQPSTAELYDIVAGLPQERYVAKGYAVTANLAVPRTVFDRIGLFDDGRFSGGDADFCQRALKAGFKLKFVPDAIVYHPARRTWSEFATKVRRMKGGQIRAGKLSRRLKYVFITLVPPIWRLWRTVKSDKLKSLERSRVVGFQLYLWIVELVEMLALLFGKNPERR